MRKLKYVKLFENLDESVYSEIQKMIDENQFLKGKVTADKNTVFEAGDFILLLSDLGHITDAHVDEKIPGSKFEKGVDLKKAIVSLVSNNKPNELFKGNEKVTDSKQADKFKWLGLDTKVPVGIENVHKLDVNSDEFKDLKVYIYKDSRGNEFKIKVKEGEGDKTTFLSFIGGKIGEIGGKPVLSVITAFPGKNGSTIANRNDFMKSGYYFTTQSKEVLSSEVKESKRFKHLKTFESFSTNEGIIDRVKDAFKSKSTKEKEKKEADLKSEYAKLLRDLRIKYDLVELLEYIQDMVTTGKALDLWDGDRLIEKTFDLEKMGQASEYYDGTNKSFTGDKSVRSALDEIGYLDITSQEVVTTKQKTQIDNKLKSVMSEVKDLEEKLKKLENFFSTNEGKITDRIKDAFKSKSTKEREEKEKKEADLKSERDKIQKEYDKLLNELEKLNQEMKSAKESFDVFQMGYGNFDEKSYNDHADEILADIKVVKEKIKKIHNNRIRFGDFRLEINSQKEKLLGMGKWND